MGTLHRMMSRILLRRAWPRTRGDVGGLPLHGNVEVLRDRWGIPHIYAGDEHDLFFTQGFTHAQDRLWQMESLRRLSEGRLSEIAGTATVALDAFARMMGMPDMKRRTFASASDRDREVMAAYADGVNAYLERRGRDLPLEFRSMGFVPEPWKPVDTASPLPYLSWFLSFWPYAAKLLAIARGSSLSLAEWDDMFAGYPGARLPADAFFDTLAGLKFGAILPAALAFHNGLSGNRSPIGFGKELLSMAAPPAGSNNWTVRAGPGGLPILANDPHLGASLPATWYFCHLRIEGGINAAGTSIAGTPGLVIGRNERVAWGLTNVMLDAADIVVYRVDPLNPTRYQISGRQEEMRREDLRIELPKGKSVSVPIHRTEAGPAVTAVEKGVDAVAAVRWLGTVPDGVIEDRTLSVMLSFLKAGSAAEVLEAARGWLYVSQNVVAADGAGHIGWHACGAAPLRRGYSGRLPADGSAGAEWAGFRAYEDMPHLMDPAGGWIATANTRPAGDDDAAPLSCYWCAPYRYDRIAVALSSMKAPDTEAFRTLQSDLHSAQADRILPKILAYPFTEPKAIEAARILGGWDREVRQESQSAALYEVFLTELNGVLLRGVLGDDMPLFFNAKCFGVEDVVFDRPDSPLWRKAGAADGAARARLVEKALLAAMGVLEKRMGRDPLRWTWGGLHRHVFSHPGATGRFLEKLLNPDPFPASGDCNTVNAQWYLFDADSYNVTTLPSMRMIVPLADIDGMTIIGPLGQSGQPGHRHYDDMNGPWERNEQVPLPLTRGAVERIVKDRLILKK